MSFSSIRMEMLNAPGWLVGWLGGIYYTGMLLGSHFPARFVLRVGHIRAYTCFASIMILSILLQYFSDIYVSWILSRLATGFTLGAFYLVIESWLFNMANPERKGAIIGLYTFVLYVGSFIGQINFRFIDLASATAFIIPAGIVAISLLPITATRTQYPTFKTHGNYSLLNTFKRAPIGSWNITMSGLFIGTANTLLPVFLYRSGFAKEPLALLLAVPILGAICLQYPLGSFSDCVNRRKLLIGIYLTMIVAMIALVLFAKNILFLSIALFIFGATLYSVFSIAMAYTCDIFDKDDYFGVVQASLIYYGVGSIVGPITAIYCMQWFHSNALFWFLTVMSLFSVAFSSLPCFLRRRQVEDVHKTPYVNAEPHTPILRDNKPL